MMRGICLNRFKLIFFSTDNVLVDEYDVPDGTMKMLKSLIEKSYF